MTERFRSRIDVVVAILLFAPIALVARMVISEARNGGDGLKVPALVLAFMVLLIGWIVLDTRYIITATDLRIHGGPLRLTVPLASIRRVRRSNTLLSAPALSFRRLEIDYGTAGVAVISPERESEFLALLKARVPEAELPV